MLGSARARRERYVGEWLPEPVPGGSPLAASVSVDPIEHVTRDESVSMALLVLLESLSPAQRVAFVMHDVFGVPFGEIADAVGAALPRCGSWHRRPGARCGSSAPARPRGSSTTPSRAPSPPRR